DEMKSNGKLSDFFAGASGLPAEYFPAAASHRLTQLGIQAGMSPEQAATSTDKQIQEYLTAWGKTPQGKAAGATATETAKQQVETSPTGLNAITAKSAASKRGALAPDVVAGEEAAAGGKAAASTRGRMGVESSPAGLAATEATAKARAKGTAS